MAKNKNIEKKSVNLLPTFFRTEKNNKFLSGTLDQLYKTPSLERIDGYVGSKLSKNYNYKSDVYISESLPLREKYQLEPALIIKELDGSIKKAFGFDDLINQVSYYGGNTDNLDQLFRPSVSSYDPHIDWDKFVNFREYYWLPNGPDYVVVAGTRKNTVRTDEVSTYKVEDSADGNFFVFTPDGLTSDPLLSFYRGVTYVFEVNSVSKFYFKTSNSIDPSAVYDRGVIGNGTSKGQVIITIDDSTPSVLYYGSDEPNQKSGQIIVRRLIEDSAIDVEQQILNKVSYRSGNGIDFINGLKVRFVGNVTPEEYADKDFIVEGVGESIKLVDFSKLTATDDIGTLYDTNFDTSPFDKYAFDNFKNLPIIPEYVTINKSSKDLNPWTRYNRWFHSDVIKYTAQANGIENPEYPQDFRASRPIIEFNPDIQLWNFCKVAIDSIDLIDTFTTDAFSKVEKSIGYYVDGVKLENGQRVIFNEDPDPIVRGKIFEVSTSLIEGKERINLTEVASPTTGDGIVVSYGDSHKGESWWFNGTKWILSQKRLSRNQAPLFDLFDDQGYSYGNINYYNSEFSGNKIFGYVPGTGSPDPVLGFPLTYYNEISLEGTYLFNNYFETENIRLIGTDTVTDVPTSLAYLRINNSSPKYVNVWTPAEPYQIPVLQFQVISENVDSIPVTVFDFPGNIKDLKVDLFVDDNKKNQTDDYTLVKDGSKLSIKLTKAIDGTVNPKRVLLKFYTLTSPNSLGTYETPINLTNNPLNGEITTLTLSEISDHVKTMASRDPEFRGNFPGVSNLKSLPNITRYGSRLISNNNPLSFAQGFITDVEHNLVDAIRSTATDYYQFRLNLIKLISEVGGQLSPADVLDSALLSVVQNKNSSFPYGRSDMLGYGNNNISREYTVTDSRNVSYSITSIFDNTVLSNRAVLVYLNGKLLTYETDYIFEQYDSNVTIKAPLSKGDKVLIKDYISTDGSYIPPTPTKLGLYPKYIPSIFVDRTYANEPVKVIQGHDGSLTVAYSKYDEPDDFRDLALLEYETRVYNNIKVNYNLELIDINDVMPGVFRNQYNSYDRLYNIVQGDFLKWTSVYGIDYSKNTSYDISNHKTYNYRSAVDNIFNKSIPGNWRGIFKYYFDTDRPDTHPWEMLGFSVKPDWWTNIYGPAPYTSGNLNLWEDLEKGLIRSGSRAGIDTTYARPGLSRFIPVDENGNVVDIREWGTLATNDSILDTDQDWIFGDHGPAETAWRRSSLWPFAVQVILALSKPADYASKMFDTSRMVKDITGKYTYGSNRDKLNLSAVILPNDIDQSGNALRSSGYSVFVVENGTKRRSDYLNLLKQDLSTVDFNLFYKAAGFLSKDKLSVIIDSIDPTSPNPGVLLPAEDYNLHFNVSAPVKSVAISGIIVEKKNAKYVVKGYDKRYPYFYINKPIRKASDSVVSVGGKSEPFLSWTANAFYQSGQIVFYNNLYYRVTKSHNTGAAFIPSNYSSLSKLPLVGGVSVLNSREFEVTPTLVPYGTQFSTLQEVYDFIVGYGKWLTSQGFIFDEYNSDLGQVLDWMFTGKEFLYWTTQNWADSSVITLSPFANSIKYQFKESTVDNVLNSFYEYSLLSATGQPYPKEKISLSRENGLCTISTKNSVDGLFFARLNLVQKEHAIILNNRSIFNDTVYDIDTGYRQSRIRLIGFKTGEWDGDFISPGFIYDDANILSWQPYTDYKIAEVVKYVGKYYSANSNILGSASFDFSQWTALGEKPVAQLFPNFDYKINQFEEFYSLDIDNFDAGQQKMAQHLIGYTPRDYLNNIFINPIAQYKFYQGFIKEKGTKNAIDKLAKASIHNLKGRVDFNEEWAFRVGSYGNFTSYNQIEFPLKEDDFRENNQLIKFVETAPSNPNDSVSYINPSEIIIKDYDFSSDAVFTTTPDTDLLILPSAGYVRADDITATAYNRNSILDIANNRNIKEGDTVWLGFREDGEWDVYRYTKLPFAILGSSISVPTTTIRFTTDRFHNLTVGDIVSVYGLDNDSDGVYVVKSISSLTSFEADTTMASLSESTTSGLAFKFASVRVGEFDEIDVLQKSIKFKEGDKVWVDSNSNGRWEVYKNVKNYTTSTSLVTESPQVGQLFGNNISVSELTDIIVVSSPNYISETSQPGRIFVYGSDSETIYPITNYGPASKTVPDNYFTGTNISKFGTSLVYDDITSAIFAGAPNASYVGNNGFENDGIVKVSKFDRDTFQEIVVDVLTNPNPADNSLFGNSLYLSKEKNLDSGNQLLCIGAVGVDLVYIYDVITSTSTSTISIVNIDSIQAQTGTNFGYSISGNRDGSIFVSSAPDEDAGKVYVYRYVSTLTNYSLDQEIIAPAVCKTGDKFGSTVLLSNDGIYLFVASTKATTTVNSPGKVFVYKNTGTSFTSEPIQILDNPNDGMTFGVSLSINDLTDTLVVTSQGESKLSEIVLSDGTTFDSETLRIVEKVENSGNAIVYNRRNELFIYATDLFDSNVESSSNNIYGSSVAIKGSMVLVGATGSSGRVYVFDKIDPTESSWKIHRSQPDLVDIKAIKAASTIDSLNEIVADYLDIIDPIKGKISGVADQEVRYKTAFDPAIYSVGVDNVVVDTDSSWVEEHVGELWWDLSTAKYQWYEQGEVEYRKNTWGTLFPGSSIDIYEWVESEYLPSQWSALADTPEGLMQGISGQPKYPDNSVVSVKQYYNSISGSTTNVYYYWVKNKITLPNVNSRKISANEVAGLIYDPSLYGTKYISILSKNALSITNVTDSLSANRIYLNISKDDLDSDINRHTEWLLLEENSPTSMPNTLLEKKLMDSLLGKDSVGNLVPDPSLPERMKYGVEIRPRQGLFKDRIGALRNLFEYVNTVLSENIITNLADFTRLNSKDEIPDLESGQYDEIVDDRENLYYVYTAGAKTAQLSCSVTNGKISGVSIDNPGYGYSVAPNVEIIGDDSGVVLKTSINENGEIVSVEIVNAGQRLISPPVLVVRPYTVIVRTDSTINNAWAKYQYFNNTWNMVYTQQYDTTRYWDYIDWASADYDSLKPLSETVEETYLLDTLDLLNGDYVKVKNQGNGKYIILRKVEADGTFNNDYDLVYSEKGTIKIKELLWNKINSDFNFDNRLTFDQSLFDQSPEIELATILKAIKDDIFVGSLKVYWNKLFFKSVRYALSEQKFLDWAFKTSFINVKNLAGSLDQRPVYKFQNSKYYEDYINEIKPYHTKIRNFSVNYEVVDPTQTYVTDFDLPPVYDKETDIFTPVSLDDPLMNSYPRKGWYDNYKLKVGRIVLRKQGSGYTSVPSVKIITAEGDTGSGATAVAYISLGKVIDIEVTNPGSGYTLTPRVLITGGGPTDLIPAEAQVELVNEKVRVNKIDLKFDRISSNREIGDKTYKDSFICDGNTFEFKLSWAAENKKSLTSVKINGITLISSEYKIVNYKELYNGYHKKYSKVVLTYTPPKGSNLDIEYTKSLALYNAVDRIEDYYSPTSGMLGKDPGQLMTGVNYPGVQLQTLPFSYSANWDDTPFAESAWGVSNPMRFVIDNPGSGYLPQWSSISTTTRNISIIPTGLDTLTNVIVTATAVAVIVGGKIATIDFTNYGTGYTSIPLVEINESTTGTTATIRIELVEGDPAEADLDTVIDGGAWSTTSNALINATGINPSDIILDGDAFVSPMVSHAPEELLPGEVLESIGINVYTKAPSGSPTISQIMHVVTSTETVTIVPLTLLPPNTGTLMVSFNNEILDYGTDYNIDFINKTVTVSTQTTTGLLGITGIGIGGIDYLSSDYSIVTGQTTANVDAEALFADIGSVYVSLNGKTLSDTEYTFSTISSKNKRGRVTVTGLGTGTNILQAWFFRSPYKGFSEVKEQRIYPDGTTNEFTLEQFPGDIGPAHANAIVELNKKRLTPPNSVYYSVSNGQLFYDIDPNNEYPSGVFDLASLEVHVNGRRVRNGIDFILDQPNQLIEFKPGFLKTGDVLAITNIVYSDYYIRDGKIYIQNITLTAGDLLKVITYTNHDGSLIRTEVFQARASRRYVMGRAILNDDYVWVSIGGNSLINSFDYYVDSDGKTVVIDDSYPFNPNDMVVIVSFTDINDDEVLGYRVFKDILNRTHYKRLSNENSTKLSQPLYSTSTEVHVDSASVLPSPIPSKNIPGIVLVAGERIEYMEVAGNTLRRIKRATLGTGAKDYYPVGTVVKDQGSTQTVPFRETTIRFKTTATNTLTYSYDLGQDIQFVSGVSPVDQIEVYYGGIMLRKNSVVVHNPSVSFDSGETNSQGVSSDITLPPQFTVDLHEISGSNKFTGTIYLQISDIIEANFNGNSAETTSTSLIIVQRTSTDWYEGEESLLTNSSIQANFLRDKRSALPDKYHYGRL